jgi:class 3 adenylate cyclase/tetratricopeptide (TPR) repeat protein
VQLEPKTSVHAELRSQIPDLIQSFARFHAISPRLDVGNAQGAQAQTIRLIRRVFGFSNRNHRHVRPAFFELSSPWTFDILKGLPSPVRTTRPSLQEIRLDPMKSWAEAGSDAHPPALLRTAMHCPKCRREIAPSANFCSHCGTELRIACRQCGAERAPTDRFCTDCGAAAGDLAAGMAPPPPLTPAEPRRALEHVLLASSREPLPTALEGENRLATVMFADMSSSVKELGALHPEDAVALVSDLLAAMVDVLLKYEGHVDRFLGDGLLAVFGAPHAHENDPERAILAALEIREAAGELGLQVTVGINTGEVYFGGIGSERHREVTVMGSVVNLASRLQAKAEPGQILVGEATHRHTRRTFEFSPLTLDLKGIDLPIVAYAVVRALPRSERGRDIEDLRAELIGRDEELATLKAVLQKALRGQGQMVSVIGEAGLGKSRLVSELKAALGRLGSSPGPSPRFGEGSSGERSVAPAERAVPLWLEGRCLELGAGTSYWLFLDLFRGYFEWRSEDDDRARGERIATSLRDLVEPAELSEERAAEMGSLLGYLFSIRLGNAWDERVRNASPEQVKHQTFVAIRDLFLALAGRRPVVLVCEDLHWADSLSLDLISLLMEALTRAPILLLCIYRPERQHRCRQLETQAVEKCPERYTELRLQELTPAQSRRLVESLLTVEDLPLSVKELILEKSRGNPFFVEEVVRSLIDSGLIYREAAQEPHVPAGTGLGTGGVAPGVPAPGPSSPITGVWRARPGIERVAVPERVQSVILSRVDRLEPDLKRVLQTAAVIGRLFRRPLLESMMLALGEGMPGSPRPEGLERALWELEDRWLIHRERTLPEEEYSFRHVLIQETIYESILQRHRMVLHQRVAEAVEELYQANLHEYYEQLAYHYNLSGANMKAVEYLLKAGEKARSSYLNDEAVVYFQQALERIETKPAGPPHSSTRPMGEAPKEWRLAALTGLGQVYLGVGNIADAERCFRQAIAVGHEIGLSTRELVRLYFRLADVLYWQSQWDELIRIGEEGLALLGEDTRSVEAALMNHTAAVGYGKRRPEKQRELNCRNAQFLLDLPYSEELRSVFYTVAATYSHSDRNAEEALKWLEVFELRAEQHHDLRALADVDFFRGDLLLAQGDLQRAIRAEQRGCERSRRIGDIKAEAWCLGLMSQAFLSSGDLQQAEVYSRQALEIMVGDDTDIARTLMVLGTVSLCRGSWEEAADAFDRAVQLHRGVGSADAARAACALGRVHLARGDRREGLRQFEEAMTLAKGDLFGLAAALSGLEEAYEAPQRFRAFCDRYRKEHPEEGAHRLLQWSLRSAEIGCPQQSQVDDKFAGTLSPDWIWHDPFADCSFSMQRGLEIHAANGRDLGGLNRSSPRLLRRVTGEFTVETVCTPVSGDKPGDAGADRSARLPALGGILLWLDARCFFRLDRGTGGKHEISFMACVGNEESIVGRGCLNSERVVLRMEQRDGRVSSLCSMNGRDWFTLGHAQLRVERPVEVGLYAIGSIDRTLYHGDYREGTAIRFDSFRLWN